MSMTVHYKHISPWLLDLLSQQPELVEPFTTISSEGSVDPNDLPSEKQERGEEFEVLDEIKEMMRDQIKEISPQFAEEILNEAELRGFTLYKYFENVQFHISGEITDHGTTLLSQAVTGGQDIGGDGPYGPPTFLGANDVERVARELSKISEHQFLTKYSPNDWDKETTEYALIYFKAFVRYYNEAAKSGHAMLVWGA